MENQVSEQHSVLYFASFTDDSALRAALQGDNVTIEHELMKSFAMGAGAPLAQFAVRFDNGYRGYLVPRRGVPNGRLAGRVWYEWHQIESGLNKAGGTR